MIFCSMQKILNIFHFKFKFVYKKFKNVAESVSNYFFEHLYELETKKRFL